MKRQSAILFFVFIVIGTTICPGGTMSVDETIRSRVKAQLLEKYGETQKFRIERGVEQVAYFWQEGDGSPADFEQFCLENFIGEEKGLQANFQRIEAAMEILIGHNAQMHLQLNQPLDLDGGAILPIDMMFAQFNVFAHLGEDLFANRIAFFVVLNFPYYSLPEKILQGQNWSRQQWAYARLGDQFLSRIPAPILQKYSETATRTGLYISEYNIFLNSLLDRNCQTMFPAGLRLICHWGLRDELKSHYGEHDGLPKQQAIYRLLERIVSGEIPSQIINSDRFQWDPERNVLYQDGKEIPKLFEGARRYDYLLGMFQCERQLDPYYPQLPTLIRRSFERDREMPEAQVKSLFLSLVTSRQVKQAARLVEKRLGRRLQPFDIWYNGFQIKPGIPEAELDRLVARKYPDAKAFERDIPNILRLVGFSQVDAEFIAARIVVDPARGSGHAAGAEMKDDKAHLRTRIATGGMNYKGFNIALHELGHSVEQTLTLQRVDHYMLRGVPNTAFTEAFAYVLQEKDFQVLGISASNPQAKQLKALDSFWASYEIMGVSLLDMEVWHWLYAHPQATAVELRQAVLASAKKVWNLYFAPIFGIRNQVILAIYSHMIEVPLYLPDYPLGHVIEFQIYRYLEGKNLGQEMERMCAAGRIPPQFWMKNAVGAEISVAPLLQAVDEALKTIRH